MIFPSNRVRLMVATKPIDFRKGHDSLAAMVKNELRKDPFTGTVFVFRAKKADRLKLLYWDGTGLVMDYKRLEEHTFTWLRDASRPSHRFVRVPALGQRRWHRRRGRGADVRRPQTNGGEKQETSYPKLPQPHAARGG